MSIRRIAIVRQRFNPAGGAERFVSRALDALASDGRVAVTLLARRWQGEGGGDRLTIDPFYLGNVWRDWGFARAVQQAVQQQQFDLVQSHERIVGCDIFRAGDGVHATWLAQRRRTLGTLGKLALQLNPYHHYTCAVEAKMFRHPQLKAVICNAKMVQHDIQQRFGLTTDQLPLIYNGVDTQRFHPDLRQHRSSVRQQFAIPDHAPLLLYVGSGFERKGVGRILSAVLPHPEVHVLVVGGDKHATRYQQQAQTLGLSSRVHFAGVQQEVRPFYGAADALILPTLYDPFPNVCVEAFASGLPVFTTTQCGAAEWIVEGKNGMVRDALDEAGWQAAIALWLAARPQWRTWSAAARHCAEPYTLASTADALIQLYEKLL